MKKIVIWSCITLILLILFIVPPTMHQLPYPRGSFGIGVTNETFIDTNRNYEFLGIKEPRYLNVCIWYPTNQVLTCSYPYGNKALIDTLIHYDDSWLGSILYLKNLIGLYPFTSCSHSNPNAPTLSNARETYPIILFSPGYGAPSFLYSALIEDLASSGFIVIGMNHTPYNGISILPNGTIIPGSAPSSVHTDIDWQFAIDQSVKDNAFILEQLSLLNNDTTRHWYKRLNLNKIGILGHSFGGAVAVETCRTKKNINAGIDLDGWLGNRYNNTGFSLPFLFIMSDHYYPTKSTYTQNMKYILETAENSSPKALVKQLPNSYHLSCTDLTLLAMPINFFIQISRHNQYLNVEKTRSAISQFFQIHLFPEED